MALGLSGFEMIMTVVPQVSGGDGLAKSDAAAGRVRNTRKLMVAAASIMAVYLVSAVLVTTLLVPTRRAPDRRRCRAPGAGLPGPRLAAGRRSERHGR